MGEFATDLALDGHDTPRRGCRPCPSAFAGIFSVQLRQEALEVGANRIIRKRLGHTEDKLADLVEIRWGSLRHGCRVLEVVRPTSTGIRPWSKGKIRASRTKSSSSGIRGWMPSSRSAARI